MGGSFIVWLDSGDPVAENVSKAEAEAIALYWQEKGYPTIIETVEESNKRQGDYTKIEWIHCAIQEAKRW